MRHAAPSATAFLLGQITLSTPCLSHAYCLLLRKPYLVLPRLAFAKIRLVLNFGKILRKHRQLQGAKHCCEMLVGWLVQGGVPVSTKPGKPPKVGAYTADALYEHLRIFSEAIVLQVKLQVEARDLGAT